jgi:hypothetical protein
VRAFPLLLVAATVLLAGCASLPSTGPSTPPPTAQSPAPSFKAVQVVHGGFEPRNAVGPDGTQWVSTQDEKGNEVVYFSKDNGTTWTKTPADPPAQPAPCCDNEIAVTPSGRVLTSIITGEPGATQLTIHYSDDGGKTWTASTGNALADQDRQWLAVGSKDPQTGQYDVYMLWHNLLSGSAQHEMLVSTSTDGGATFGPGIPIALPGSQAWNDLQCADSGGPSNIVADPRTGQVFAVFATRSSVAGGCGASATQQFEINVVAATRIWVATSTDRGTTWTDSLAVDDSTSGKIVGMQLNSGALDDAGNLYVVYPESPQPYPNYEGAAVKYVWAAKDLKKWSAPVTVENATGDGKQPGTGHLLTNVEAGAPGHVALFYLSGDGNGTSALWYPTIAVTSDGQDAAPAFTIARVGEVPAWKGTASQLMGVCNPVGDQLGPASPIANAAAGGFACPRSSDVFGQAMGADCRPTFVWYDNVRLDNATGGTYVSEQTGGPALC